MAGSATVALAAVSNAGGLGSLGYVTTPKPFNLNFFTHSPPQENKEINARTRNRLKYFYEEVGLAEVPETAKTPFGTFDTDMLSLLTELKPAVTSFHFGLPETEMTDKQPRSIGSPSGRIGSYTGNKIAGDIIFQPQHHITRRKAG